jgi:hypothetical protein
MFFTPCWRPLSWWAACVVFAVVATSAQPPRAEAQVSTLNVLKRTTAAVALEEAAQHQVLFIQIDNVARNSVKSQTYTLTGGSRYRVYAIGDDDRITDIDLAVYDGNNNLITKDDDEANVAIVGFSLRNTTKVTFKVTPAEMKRGVQDGFYGLVVVRMD